MHNMGEYSWNLWKTVFYDLRRDVEYSVHKGQISWDDNLRKSDAQVDSYLKLLVKWNPVFLVIAKDLHFWLFGGGNIR